MTKTIEEFFESTDNLKFLVQNLNANLDVFGHQMSKEDQESLMRVNLIMIRQCIEGL